MSKTALLIAFHFPPVAGSSGLQRTLALAKHLPAYGYRPIVLTVHPRAYESTNPDSMKYVPESTTVVRATALDAARHMSIAGKYPDFLARPDRWRSWWLTGSLKGLQVIRKFAPSIIWSTFPIATAHSIGYTLHRSSGIPWVADFRDSMTEENYPADIATRRIYKKIEKQTIENAQGVVFTTDGAQAMYADRYPTVARKLQVIPNGYDEEAFEDAEAIDSNTAMDKRFTLLHSGIIYPKERDPEPLFEAIANLRDSARISPDNFELRLRATGHDGQHSALIEKYSIGNLVSILPALPYVSALAEMMSSSCLLLLQSESCNHQIPAKVYEYFRAKRPIFALTHDDGDTAKLLRKCGHLSIAPLDDAKMIATGLLDLVSQPNLDANIMSNELIHDYSREAHSRKIACLFDELANRDGAH